jgi:WD40 repeat protein
MASFLDEQRHVDYHVELSPDDRWFAIQEGKDYKNDKLRVIDLRSGNEQRAFDVPTDAKACWSFFRFSPGGQLFAANTGKQGDEQITVWDLGEKRAALVLRGACPPFAFAPDGKHIAVTVPEKQRTDTEKGEICFRDLAGGEERGRCQLPKGSVWVNMCFSPDGATLCADCDNHGIRSTCAWDVKTNRELFWLEGTSNPRFVPDGKKVVLHGLKGHVLIDTATWKQRAFVSAHDGDLIPVAAGPDLRSNLLVHSREFSHTANPISIWLKGQNSSLKRHIDVIEVYDVETEKMITTIQREDAHLIPFLTPDPSTLLITASKESTDQAVLEVWDVPPHSAWEYRAVSLGVLTLVFVAGIWLLRRRLIGVQLPKAN